MIETLLRRFLDHPARHWAVIIMTLGLGLMVVLPLVDEYTGSRQNRERLTELVALVRHEVTDLEDVQQKVQEKRDSLRELEALAFTADQVDGFQEDINDWALASNCQVRRTRLEPPTTQAWQEGDRLPGSTSGGRNTRPTKQNEDDPPYLLKTQPITLVISGTLPDIKRLLIRLHSTGRLIQSEGFSISRPDENKKEIVLDLELKLYDLTRVDAPAGPKAR